MKRKVLAVSAIITLIFIICAASFAKMGDGGPGYGPEKNSALALTDDQKDKIFKIRNAMEGDINALKTDLNQQRYDLQKVLSAATIDEKQAMTLHQRISGIQNKIQDRFFQAHLDILKILTPEQRETWSKHRMFGRPWMRDHRRPGNFQGHMMGDPEDNNVD